MERAYVEWETARVSTELRRFNDSTSERVLDLLKIYQKSQRGAQDGSHSASF